MLAFKGNTAIYLMYAYTRIRSLRVRANITKEKEVEILKSPVALNEVVERTLALKLVQFSEVLATIENTLTPNMLCSYLYDLAWKFHTFYEHCRIISTPEEASRMKLCFITEDVLKTGLHLLGVNTVERI